MQRSTQNILMSVVFLVGILWPAQACKEYETCEKCSSEPYCGWCATTKTCLPGNDHSPYRRVECNDWRFSSDACGAKVNSQSEL
mmetsp:Transcript_18913/g.31037  ORF Transcript_18913/g.31037 Transcript_18913/m.31037 type:complete len:84 (+) Transcript_18913:275-526(+)